MQALPAILKWGLAAEDKAGGLTAVPLPKALQRLDDVFDNIYSFSVSVPCRLSIAWSRASQGPGVPNICAVCAIVVDKS